jgi:hypothetical protein
MGPAGTFAITVPGSEVTGGAVLGVGTAGAGAAVPTIGAGTGVGVDATPDVFTAAMAAFIDAGSVPRFRPTGLTIGPL